ncbi:DUF4394 domain-containing protein [Actinomadura rudentiformis]|uniref:DUF4394 domain-containing protein n=2 Tax=Actinomadura rudentiformis TaxID=359158 RepID=A0A6H9YVU6_9ACTN|nr:DUF4394 domain-containing protein [Actinomadura rudentiformis]
MAYGSHDDALRLIEPAGASKSAPQASKIPSLKVIGLTGDQRLVAFRSTDPGAVSALGKVSGLKGDRSLVGIDFRVQNGKLYGVGDQGGIYTLHTGNASAAKVSQLTVALQGKNFGVDFNPAANRLRVISDTGQNLRHNIDDPAGAPAAGVTATDGTLTNPPVPPAQTGATATNVTGAAYTNNDLDTNTATTLFDLDTALDQTSAQSPANAGNLAPTGKLRVDAGPNAGFDVYYSAANGTNTGYATLQLGSKYRFYRTNLLTGRAIPVGAFPGQVVDVALPLNQG